MSFIEIENVTKTFNGVDVLKNINLNIEEGEVLGILGRSGAGKSVLMHMIRGMEEYRPDKGKIFFNIAMCPECDLVEAPSKVGTTCRCGSVFDAKRVDFWDGERNDFTNIKHRISIMLQRTFALYEETTVIENVMKAMENSNYSYDEKIAIAIDLLDQTQMNHRIIHIARDLSGGEKQRVVLARQIAKNPILFLADEPTGTLDPKTAKLIHETLSNKIKEEGITMVINSHWPEVMKELADKVVWLEKGEIKEIGDPETVVNKFVAEIPVPKKVEKYDVGGPIIETKDLKKHYYSIDRGVVKSVDGVDVTINEGEIFGIVGLSGAGKTTLSRIIFGITEPSSGEIKIKLGEKWIDMKEKGPYGRGRVTPYLGLLHQEYALYPYSTVLENLTDSISLELPAEFAKMKSIYVLDAVGFPSEYAETILNKKPDELSGGEKHRVALAQVLIKEPRIIILDEPTGTMDPITKTHVTDSILKTRDELDETFIIISHDMDFVLDVCDRAVLMRNGKILKEGKPDEIVEELDPHEKEKMLKG